MKHRLDSRKDTTTSLRSQYQLWLLSEVSRVLGVCIENSRKDAVVWRVGESSFNMDFSANHLFCGLNNPTQELRDKADVLIACAKRHNASAELYEKEQQI